MLIKISCVMAVCVLSWLLGQGYGLRMKERIYLIEDYVSFTKGLKSAIAYSGKNIYTYISQTKINRLKNFEEHIFNNKSVGIKASLRDYRPLNEYEGECIRILYSALVCLENSSDAIGIAGQLDEAINSLELYKNEIREASFSKIKTAPPLALMAGLFIAVLLI